MERERNMKMINYSNDVIKFEGEYLNSKRWND